MTEQPEKAGQHRYLPPGKYAQFRDADRAVAEIDRLRKDQEEWSKLAASQEEDIDFLLQQRDRLLAALNLVMLGGNHIATYRTDQWPSYGTEPADALEKLGAGQEYDMWCCWAAIMTARAAVANQDANSKVKG